MALLPSIAPIVGEPYADRSVVVMCAADTREAEVGLVAAGEPVGGREGPGV